MDILDVLIFFYEDVCQFRERKVMAAAGSRKEVGCPIATPEISQDMPQYRGGMSRRAAIQNESTAVRSKLRPHFRNPPQ
jgi:hypothetical protein